MTASERTVVRPDLVLDVVTGELLAERALVVDGDRIAGVVAAGDAPAEALRSWTCRARPCCPA
jgi:hypothetical protein